MRNGYIYLKIIWLSSYGNSQDDPLPMNGLRKCGTYTQWNFIQSQRRMKLCH
jgi:hypothetical protein